MYGTVFQIKLIASLLLLLYILQLCSSEYHELHNLPKSTNCTLCPPGYYASSKDESCEACKADGQPGACLKLSDCTLCPNGTASNKTGAEVCEECQPGFAQPASGKTECIACSPGYYSKLNGSAECLPCGAGYWTKDNASISCNACEPGHFNPFDNATYCEKCPKGSFQQANASARCLPCSDGTNCDELGCTICNLCPWGYTAVGYGNAICSPCQPGTFKPMAGSGDCQECPAGQYTLSNETGAHECNICPYGYYCQCPICLPERCIIPSQCPPGTSHYIYCPSVFLQPSANPQDVNCSLSILSIILISIASGLVAFILAIVVYRVLTAVIANSRGDVSDSTAASTERQRDAEYNPLLMAGNSNEKKKFGAL